jgi:hypothetical protein
MDAIRVGDKLSAHTPNRTADNDAIAGAGDRAFATAAVAIVGAFTLLRLVYASQFDLRTDEAYYWTWSKEWVLSYLDHPPMIASFVRLGTAIFGDTNLGARFGGIVAMAVSELLIADIVRRTTRSMRWALLAVLLFEATPYYGLLMAKIAPDTALIPFAAAMLWSLVRLAETKDARWWLAAGAFFGLAMLSKYTATLLLPAVAAFAFIPDWRGRWLRSAYPWAGLLLALAIFSPVLWWNAANDWASFRFQAVRATSGGSFSLRTVADLFALQLGQVGPIMLPVILSGVVIMAVRGVRQREPVALLLGASVLVPLAYFLERSLTLRVGDTWPMFLWPPAFAAVAINLADMSATGTAWRTIAAAKAWIWAAVASGVVLVLLVFGYTLYAPTTPFGRTDPIGAEAGYTALADAARAEMESTGATWIATTDYRTYAMLRWHLRDSVPVVEINERARFIGFRDPGMDRIAGHPGLLVTHGSTSPADALAGTTVTVHDGPTVPRTWRGVTYDTYRLDTIMGWTPELNPDRGSEAYGWRVLAGP